MKGPSILSKKKGFYDRSGPNFRGGRLVGVLAHFVAQPSKFSQRLYAVSPVARSSKVKFEEGKSIYKVMRDKRSSGWANKHRFEIADQLAEMFVDFMSLGIAHRDLHSSNIILKRGKDGKPIVKAIDFEFARTLDQSVVNELYEDRCLNEMGMDLEGVKSAALNLSKNNAEREELRRYFNRKFEKLVKERL
ncbi:hypothetical protein H0N95_00955 [Candidatus Micrarchaeota archaeon]|nr:hypothetical protein [Candidatus Micrarchaeota archaeon]